MSTLVSTPCLCQGFSNQSPGSPCPPAGTHQGKILPQLRRPRALSPGHTCLPQPSLPAIRTRYMTMVPAGSGHSWTSLLSPTPPGTFSSTLLRALGQHYPPQAPWGAPVQSHSSVSSGDRALASSSPGRGSHASHWSLHSAAGRCHSDLSAQAHAHAHAHAHAW